MSVQPDLIQVHASDTVATALRDLDQGQQATVADPDGTLSAVTLLDQIRMGHKIALQVIDNGDLVLKHGRPIGRATATISIGAHVHVQNVESLSIEDTIDGTVTG